MASLPGISSLNLEGMQDAEGGVDPERLFFALNQFIGPTYEALSGQLSVDNLRAEWLEWPKLDVPASAGRVYAEYTTNTAQNLGNATHAVMDFEDRVTDTHSAVTTGAAWKFTVPTGCGGTYAIAWRLSVNTTATAAELLSSLFKSTGGGAAAEFRQGSRIHKVATAQIWSLQGSVKTELLAGDYVYVSGYSSVATQPLEALAAGNYVSIARLEDESTARTLPSCFPFDMALRKLKGPPKAVFLAGAWTTPDPSTSVIISPGCPQWTFTTKDGRPHIRIRNLPGLTAGNSYKLRFLVVGE